MGENIREECCLSYPKVSFPLARIPLNKAEARDRALRTASKPNQTAMFSLSDSQPFDLMFEKYAQ